MVSANVSQVLKDIQENGLTLDQSNPESTKALLSNARALVDALETPHDKFSKFITHYPTLLASIRLGIELNLFNTLLEQDGASKSVDALAKTLGADTTLLGRVFTSSCI